MSKWFRCWTDIKDDPKMLGIGDHDFRIWIHLLALTSEEGDKGVLPPFQERGLAATLRTSLAKWRSARALFVSLRMVEVRADDGLTITNWPSRQYVSDDSTQRSKKHRATLQKPERNAHATHQITETETDPETETDLSSSSAGAREKCIDWFEHVTGKPPWADDKAMREVLEGIDFAHPKECVAAVWTASIGKQEPWPYAKRIFDSCIKEGHEPRARGKHEQGRSDVRGGAKKPATRAVGDLSAFERFGT